MDPVPACTIAANNYLALVKVLAASYCEHHPDAPFVACIADEPHSSIDYDSLPFTVVFARDLGIPRFANLAFRYRILELNTAVKPFLLQYLRDSLGFDRAFYLDPDILVTARLTRLEDALDEHQMVLTPHITEPLDNLGSPSEIQIRSCGVYNLGFAGMRFDHGTAAFLDWWGDRLLEYCYHSLPEGLFVDQSWAEYAPAFLDRVAIDRGPEYNVAYWNLPHRAIERRDEHWRVDGRRMGFFHFSGVRFDDLDAISRYQDRLTLADRPELRPLFEGYRDLVSAAGHEQLTDVPYAYGRFSNGTSVGSAARWSLRKADPQGERWADPFDAGDDDGYFQWLRAPVHCPDGTLTRAAGIVWNHRPDVQAVYPHYLDSDLVGFQQWLFTRPLDELFGFEPVFFVGTSTLLPEVSAPSAGADAAGDEPEEDVAREGGASTEVVTEPEPPGPEPLHLGVHVYGYVYAESGVGQHTRLLVEALHEAGAAYSVHPWHATASRQEHPFRDFGRRALTGIPMNVVGVNADVFPSFVGAFGHAVVESRYTIALWAWELEDFPEWMARSAGLVDEVWANSSFSATAIRKMVDVPVLAFPLPVRVPQSQVDPAALRRRFGLAERFVFLATFDFDSRFERKNPVGAVRAFCRAFEKNEDAVLVVKCVNGTRHVAKLHALEREAARHPGVMVIDTYLPADEQAALLAAADAYVSLHRAEGFGLALAESMALGKPVIATGYSGNLDYMTHDNSYLVPCDLAPVPRDCDPYPRTAHWAEPDIAAAASMLRQVFDDPAEAALKGARGREEILSQHSPSARAAFIRQRLGDLEHRLVDGSVAPRVKTLQARAVSEERDLLAPDRAPTAEREVDSEEEPAPAETAPGSFAAADDETRERATMHPGSDGPSPEPQEPEALELEQGVVAASEEATAAEPTARGDAELAAQIEHVRGLVVHGPDPAAPGRGGVVRWLRRAVMRVLRFYDLHERSAGAALVDLIERVDRRASDQAAALHAELSELRRRLDEERPDRGAD